MTTAQALLVFDVLQDQYGAPYFPEDWKLKLFNMAQLEVLNRMVPDTIGGTTNFEYDSNVFSNLSPLVFTIDTTLNNSSESQILYSTMETLVRAQSGDSGATIFRIIRVACLANGVVVPVFYTPYNKSYSYETNVFKKGSITEPRWSFINTSGNRAIVVYPYRTGNVTLSIIKSPKVLTSGNTPDWDDYVMNQVILQALKLAGIAINDTQEIQNVLQAGIQSGQ